MLGDFWRRARRRSGHRLLAFVVEPRPSVMESPRMRREDCFGGTQASMLEMKYQCAADWVLASVTVRLPADTALPNCHQLVVREPGWLVMLLVVWPLAR